MIDKAILKRFKELGLRNELFFNVLNQPIYMLEYKLLNLGDIIRKEDEVYISFSDGSSAWTNIKEYEEMGCKSILGERYKYNYGPIRRESRREVEEADKAIKLLGILCNVFNEDYSIDLTQKIINMRDNIIEEWLGDESECVILEGKWTGYKGIIINSESMGKPDVLYKVKIKATGEVLNYWNKNIRKCNESVDTKEIKYIGCWQR